MIVGLPVFIMAQADYKDSLLKELPALAEDTTKVNLLLALSREYFSSDLELAKQ